MRHSCLIFLSVLVVSTCAAPVEESFCEPGTRIFCKCRGGSAPGEKVCADDGDSFGVCIEPGVGECLEVDDSSSAADGTAGAAPTGAGGFGGSAAGECAHDLCEAGVALAVGCHPCVDVICKNGVDPFCCNLTEGTNGFWDETCISEASELCGLGCVGAGATGAGGASSTSTAASTTNSSSSTASVSSSATASSSMASSSSGGMSCLGVGTVTAGSLVITEIMNNPAAATDAAGEWFELYNPGPNCVELKGLTLTSKSDLPHTVGTSVVVLAGKYAVIGRNADMALNGKIAVDYN
ncbi:MAG: lamin tail domain-containing protein [Myxococcales bacterium]|nr:lamin tail domain-containing protein [Myxococcales bacterium]